jgi:cytidine deaminase
MREFCKPDQFRVLLGTSPDDCKSYLLEELLPVSFGPENLQEA